MHAAHLHPLPPPHRADGGSSPHRLKNGTWVVHLRFPNNTHTKVVVKESATIEHIFHKPLDKRGFILNEVALHDDQGRVLDWQALGSILQEQGEITVIDLTRK